MLKFIICISSLFLVPQLSFAQSLEPAPSIDLEEKSIFLVPFTNLVIPGFGQFLDGQYTKGSILLSYDFIGLYLYVNSKQRMEEFDQSESLHYHHYQDLSELKDIGSSITTSAGLFSAYDSFNFRIKAYQAQGKYLFVPKNQNLNDLLVAPFHFSYLKRWTTWTWITLGMLMSVNDFNRSPTAERTQVRSLDVFAGSYTSYNAGTGEEAFFRGYLYPVFYEYMSEPWLANGTQATLFALAHGYTEPYWQLAFGLYSGWLTERNHFDLGESIFIHAWWDFWTLTAYYIRSRSFTKDYDLHLPLLTYRF